MVHRMESHLKLFLTMIFSTFFVHLSLIQLPPQLRMVPLYFIYSHSFLKFSLLQNKKHTYFFYKRFYLNKSDMMLNMNTEQIT